MPTPKKPDTRKKNKLVKGLLSITSVLIIVGIYALVFIALFSLNLYWAHTRNNKIEGASTSPITTRGVVTDINKGRHNHHANFIFVANGRTYAGETFQDYYGHIADSVCITYNSLQPIKNIYCDDIIAKMAKKDVLRRSAIDSLLFTALLIFLILLTILREKIRAKKKTNMLP